MSKNTVNYTKMGRMNRTINPRFIKICKMSQQELKIFLNKELQKYYKNVISQDGFIYCKGKQKVLLTAHLDTVHKDKIKSYYEYKKDGKHILSSPQGIGGDDRCGVYMILKILETTTLRPSILFCEDEEIGGVGSEKFVETKFIKDLEKMYFLIELDRKGINDAVFYDDENYDFHTFTEKATGFNENWGSFSDISNLSPACKVSSVNLSCGYYNQHTTDEYVVLEEMENSIKQAINMINAGIEKKEKFKYIEYTRNSYINDNWYSYSYMNDIRNRYYGGNITNYNNSQYQLWILFNENGEENEEILYGSENEMWQEFFFSHPSVCFNDVIDYDLYNGLESLNENVVNFK